MRARYPEYRDSGIEWLGDIPAHWHVQRLSRSVSRSDTKVEPEDEKPMPYVGLEHVASWTGCLLSLDEDLMPEGTCNRFTAGEVLFSKLRPYLAKAFCAEFDGLCTTEFLTLKPLAHNSRYLLYLLLTDGFITLVDSSTYGARMPRASWDFIGEALLLVPPVGEQQAIAAFLDRETGKIDELVEKKRLLLERLAEYRTALITRTVTKGLPASAAEAAGLDPSPRLKPSSVEWLGDIPAHWHVAPVRRCFTIVNGGTPSSSEEKYWDGEIVWLTPDDLGRNPTAWISTGRRSITDEGVRDSCTHICPKGSIVMSTRAPIGHLAIALLPVTTNQGCRTLVPDYKTDSSYAYYLFVSMRRVLQSLGKGTTFMELTSSDLGSLVLVRPPVREQQAIAAFLDERTRSIDLLCERVETAIERLEEYRTALVTAAVTGKINVLD